LLQRSKSKLQQLYYDQYGDYYRDDSDADSLFEQGLNQVPSRYHLEPERDGIPFQRRQRSGYETQQRERLHEKNKTLVGQSTQSFAKDIIDGFSKKIDDTPVSPIKIKALGPNVLKGKFREPSNPMLMKIVE
jgi:hypothetical protein